MSFTTDLKMAYHMGYDDALAKRKPDASKVHMLGRGECKPMTYDNGYSMDRIEPGEYYEFWEPACACSECGELIPMRRFCPNCGAKVVDPTTNDVDGEVDDGQA